MEYFVRSSPLLQRKLAFLAKYGSLVQISPTTICTPTIQMRLPAFCNFSAGIAVADLLELVKCAGTVAMDGNILTYTYTTTASSATVRVKRTVRLHSLDYSCSPGSASVSIKVARFALLTRDEVCLTYKDDALLVDSRGFIKTGISMPAELLDGEGGFACRVGARDLGMLDDLDGDLVLSYHGNYLVAYGLETDSETAALIRILS